MTKESARLAKDALGVLTAFEASAMEKAAAFVEKYVNDSKAADATDHDLHLGMILVAHDLLHECPEGVDAALARLGSKYAAV